MTTEFHKLIIHKKGLFSNSQFPGQLENGQNW